MSPVRTSRTSTATDPPAFADATSTDGMTPAHLSGRPTRFGLSVIDADGERVGQPTFICAIGAISVKSGVMFVSVPHFDRVQVPENPSAPPDGSFNTGGVTAATSRRATRHKLGATYGLAVAAAGVVAALAGHGAVGLAAAALALAISLAKDRSVLSCVPAASVLVMAGVVVLVQFPLIAKWPDFGITGVARVSVAGLCIAAGLVVWLRRRTMSSVQLTDLPEVVALSPALFLTGVGVWMATLPVTLATNWFFLWGDNVMRARDVSAIGALGRLDYSAYKGPGGWLSFVSLAVVSETDSRDTAGGLLALVSTNAQMLWTLYVLVCAATSLTAVALARRFGAHRWAAALAGLGAGAVMCWPQFFVFTMGAGFQSTIVLTLLLAVAASEVLMAKAGELRAVIVCSAAVVLTAHNYPPGVPVAGVLWLGAMARYRQGRGVRVDRRDRSVIVIIVCSALATVPVLQMFSGASGVGVSRVAAVGSVMRLPVEWVVPGILAAILCLAWPGHSRAVRWVGMAVLIAFLEPIGAWLLLDVPLQSYYPTKLLWHVAALGLPLVWAWISLGFVVLTQRLRPRLAKQAVAASTCVILTVTVLVGLVGVLPAALGFWSLDQGRILISATSIDAPKAQVVWRAGENEDEDWRIQRLVSTYSMSRGLPGYLSIPVGLSEQCETLRSVAAPAVLTSATQAEVTERFGCAPGVVGLPVLDPKERSGSTASRTSVSLSGRS